MTKEQVKVILNERYAEELRFRGPDYVPSKLEFLSSDVFDYTTYDGAADRSFAMNTLRVIKAIYERKTFEFIENNEDYRVYLTVVNFPFLRGKLEWGGSIRGAWFDRHATNTFIACNGEIEVDHKDIGEFMLAILEWSEQFDNIITPEP